MGRFYSSNFNVQYVPGSPTSNNVTHTGDRLRDGQ